MWRGEYIGCLGFGGLVVWWFGSMDEGGGLYSGGGRAVKESRRRAVKESEAGISG